MSKRVLCLRPKEDFIGVGVTPPDGLDIEYRGPDDADVPDLFETVQALVIPAVGPAIDPAMFGGTGLKLIQVTGAGVDRIDRKAAEKSAIPVANVPGGSNAAIAEYVIACSLVLLRGLCAASGAIRKGDYAAFRTRNVDTGPRGLEGLTAGIIGLGTIGQAVAEALAGRGCRIVFYDPEPPAAAIVEKLSAKAVSLNELLGTADIVSLHVPLLEQTHNLIGAAELARMKENAILINAARGGIVDETALADRLGEGRIAGAAVDVYAHEPPESDNPLLKLDGEGAGRLLLTPHIAGVTRQAWAYLFTTAWDNVERVLIQGEEPHHRVY